MRYEVGLVVRFCFARVFLIMSYELFFDFRLSSFACLLSAFVLV
jgi:hypothetical protein